MVLLTPVAYCLSPKVEQRIGGVKLNHVFFISTLAIGDLEVKLSTLMKLKVSYNIIKLEIPAHFLILTILSQGSIFWVQNLFSYFLEKENFSHVCAGTTTCEKIVQKIIKIVEKVFLIANDVRKLCKKDLKLLKHSIFGYKF